MVKQWKNTSTVHRTLEIRKSKSSLLKLKFLHIFSHLTAANFELLNLNNLFDIVTNKIEKQQVWKLLQKNF